MLELAVLVAHRADAQRRQLDVRPVEVAQDDLRVSQPETATDLSPYRRSCGRRQCHPHGGTKRIRLCPQPHVLGAEVVPPLAYEVGFVDGEEPRARTPQNLARLPVRE